MNGFLSKSKPNPNQVQNKFNIRYLLSQSLIASSYSQVVLHRNEATMSLKRHVLVVMLTLWASALCACFVDGKRSGSDFYSMLVREVAQKVEGLVLHIILTSEWLDRE